MVIKLIGNQKTVLAVPDFRGSGAAQTYMGVFNDTLFGDLQNSGFFDMAPKGMYPLQVPQRPEEFRQPARPGASSGGLWLSDWASPPVSANYLVTGYTAEQNGQIVLYGWLFDVAQPTWPMLKSWASATSVRWMRPAPARWPINLRRTFWPTGEARRCTEQRSTSNPTAPATRKSGPWTPTAPIRSG